MPTFLALYRGRTVSEAQIVAVSTDPELIDFVASQILKEERIETDLPLRALDSGRKQALRLIREELK